MAQNNGWELQKDVDGVQVYTRITEKSDFKEVKVETILETRLSVIVAVIKDVENYTEWLYECVDSRLLKKVNEKDFYYYSETEAPWPVSNRDVVVRTQLSQDANTKVVTSYCESVNDFHEKYPDKVRIEYALIEWTFAPQKNNRIKLIYHARFAPGGNLPAWLVNTSVVSGPYSTIYQLREMVKHNEYKSKKFSFIVD